jgi:hypothetical protein
MPIQFNEENGGKLLVIHLTGKLEVADYELVALECERLIRQQRKLSILFEMAYLEGWDAGALWEEIKFDMLHFADIKRVAIVGDKKWQEVMATLYKPFTKAESRYFDINDIASARKWLEEA